MPESTRGEACPTCGAPVRSARRFCANCGSDLRPTRSPAAPAPQPASAPRRIWEGGPEPAAPAPRRSLSRPFPRWGWGVGAAVLAIVVVVALLSNRGYGLGGSSSAPPNTTPSGPDPNPYNEALNAVVGSIVYSGNATGYFSGIEGINLCGPCPVVPHAYPGVTPTVAGLSFAFNLTNTGGSYHTLSRFSLTTTNSQNQSVYHLGGLYCCAPAFDETVTLIGILPGQTVEFLMYVFASSVPSNGGQGYSLEFIGTSTY